MKRLMRRFDCSHFVMAGALFLLIAFVPALVIPETISVLAPPEASKVVAVRNTTVQDNIVSGELLNLSSHRVRDVELLIMAVTRLATMTAEAVDGGGPNDESGTFHRSMAR